MSTGNTEVDHNQSTFMSVSACAERLGVSDKTLWRYLNEHRIGHIRLGGGRKVFISEEHLVEFLAAYEVPAVKPNK